MEFFGSFASSVLSTLMRRPKEVRRRKDQIRHVYLPEDVLITKILPRLPVETLMRFKCVSKNWYNLITNDSHFISAHLRYHSQASKQSIVFAEHLTEKTLKHFLLLMINESKVVESDVPFMLPIKYYNIVGSCNGLVCVYLISAMGPSIVLWNPATRELRNVPVAIPDCVPSYALLGFWFDEDSNDYKVVRIVKEMISSSAGLIPFHVQVFATSTDSWREVCVVKSLKEFQVYTIGESCNAVQLDGALYWLGWRLVTPEWHSSRYCVLSFDLHDEELRVVNVPNSDYNGLHQRFELTKFRDSLCLLSFQKVHGDGEGYHTDIWFMNKPLSAVSNDNDGDDVDHDGESDGQGDFSAWTTKPICLVHKQQWNVRGVWMDQFIVQVKRTACDATKLVLYDPFSPENIGSNNNYDHNFHDLISTSRMLWYLHEVHEYVPSLVSAYNPGEKKELVMIAEKKKVVMIAEKRKKICRLRKLLRLPKRGVHSLFN